MNTNNLFDMTGAKVIITGGGTGLGKGFARHYMQAGADVMLAARREPVLQEAVDELNALGLTGHASYVCMDVSSSDSIKAAYASIDKWGLANVLINNAGVVNGKSMLDVTEDEWDFVQDINFKGVWLVTREFVSRFIARREDENKTASIVNIASILGISNLAGSSTYGASKAALIHLTKTMAMEWSKYGVRANAICPGYIKTDMAEDYIESPFGQKLVKQIPHRRFGDVEDVCGAALLLASPASRYMTGSIIAVDGGHSIAKIV